MEEYTKSSAEAIAKYVRNSKRLQRVNWGVGSGTDVFDANKCGVL
jgi:hypothetical protein